MPVWRVLLVCCCLSLPHAQAAAAEAPPIADSDVVGVLYGDTYTYGDLKVDDIEAARLTGVFPVERHVGVLLAPVAVKFRQIVLLESVRRELPDCDVTVSAAEVTEYISWWQQRLAPILPHIESLQGSNPELENLEVVEPANEAARRLAKQRILR